MKTSSIKQTKAKLMMTAVSIHNALKGTAAVNKEYAEIDSLAAECNLTALEELWRLVVHETSEIPDWASRAVRGRILESLSLSVGLGQARTAMKIAYAGRTVSARDPQIISLCSRLAAAQPADIIDQLLATDHLEFAGCLLYEALFRRKIDAPSRAAIATLDRLTQSNHPLACLPVRLLDIESGVALPAYRGGSVGWSIPFGPTRAGGRYLVDRQSAQKIVEVTTTEWVALAQTAFNDWTENSNGHVEARSFELSVIPSSAWELLSALPVDSLAHGDEIHLTSPSDAANAFRILFSASSNGGAYSHGQGAAYGRHDAWSTLRALVGSSRNECIDRVDQDAMSREWITFDSPNSWFAQIAWDVGLVCVDRNSKSVNYIAATDTD